MSFVGTLASELQSKAGQPAFAQFYTEAKHLPKASEQAGHYVAIDMDMVEVRQIGSVNSVKFKVEQWLKQNDIEVTQGRMPSEHAEKYRESYRRWKAGQELPIEGTPIKSWPVITPAQVKMVLEVGVRTVEELSELSDEGLKRIGMGAIELKNKAKAWMAASQDKGKLAQEMAALQQENSVLKGSLDTLTAQVNELKKLVKMQSSESIIEDQDLLDEEPAPKARKK